MDGTIDLLHGIGDRTDVILMSVGNEHTPQFFLVCCEIGKIRDHQIHAVHIFIGETHTAVHNDHILAVFQHSAVLADLV